MATSKSLTTIDDIARRLERMPQTIQREALRPAARVARVAGYTMGAAELARETGTEPVKWKRSHRVFTAVQPDGVSVRLWMGIAPYLHRRRRSGNLFREFASGYNPAAEVGPKMEEAYVRVARGKIREILGD